MKMDMVIRVKNQMTMNYRLSLREFTSIEQEKPFPKKDFRHFRVLETKKNPFDHGHLENKELYEG